MERIKWLDSSRGLAILCLVFIHYIGALESRGFISYDLMNIIKSIFRVATPYFIFTFGFTFSIVYLKKIIIFSDLTRLYRKLYKRLLLVVIAREIIVLISTVRYPEMANELLSILLYQEFSKSGEILTFYFFAILLAPITLFFMKQKSNLFNILLISTVYITGFYVGITFPSLYSSLLFRLFFYDVYAFLPFFSLAMFGMFCGILYRAFEHDLVRLKFYLLTGSLFIIIGTIILQFITDTPIYTLATASLKAPPHIAYMLIYAGLSITLTAIVAICSTQKYVPKFLFDFLDILGRNSLLSYVLHYFLFIAAPISMFIFSTQNNQYELYTFIAVLILLFSIVYSRDTYKQKKIRSNKVGSK